MQLMCTRRMAASSSQVTAVITSIAQHRHCMISHADKYLQVQQGVKYKVSRHAGGIAYTACCQVLACWCSMRCCVRIQLCLASVQHVSTKACGASLARCRQITFARAEQQRAPFKRRPGDEPWRLAL